MRVIAYVDGFSCYAGLNEYIKKYPNSLEHNKVNLWHLIENHLLHQGETLEGVRWYSAIPPNSRDPEQNSKTARHRKYRQDLEATGINTRISGFKKRPIKCKHCGKTTKHRQEKESDNRCSLEMLEDALFDHMDRALLISADSDFIPALYSIKRYSEVRPVDVVVCAPLGRENPSKDIRGTCEKLFNNTSRYIYPNQLKNSLF